ncbi:hypothetical protein [Solihabitans fulvus]|nr:hypothetical protein [Solihabitans fulvus]
MTISSVEQPAVLVDEQFGPDPLAGIPQEVLDATGDYDRDSAGGCG